MRKRLPALALLAIASLLFAQEDMNNAAVIKLLKAGLSDDLIVNTIDASPGKYDTSADALDALQERGRRQQSDFGRADEVRTRAAARTRSSHFVAGRCPQAAEPASKIPHGVDGVGVYFQARDESWKVGAGGDGNKKGRRRGQVGCHGRKDQGGRECHRRRDRRAR